MIASIIVSIAVEGVVMETFDYLQFRSLKGDLTDARDGLEKALSQGDDYRLYLQADAVMKRAVNAATYVNYPLQQALKEFSEGAQAVERSYKAGTSEYRDGMNELARDLAQAVYEFQQTLDSPTDPDYETLLVLGFLRNHDEAGIATLSETARKQAQEYQAQFSAWLERNERDRGATLAPGTRDRLFRKFANGLSNEYDRRLGQELRQGKIRRNATHILLQAASYLKSTGKDFVEDQADALLAIVARNDLLVRNALAEENATAGIAEQDQKFLEGPLPPGGVPTPSTAPKPTGSNDLDGGTP
jgi:hypothetical protein